MNISAINKHLKNIYEEGELNESSTISKMEIVQNEENRNNLMVGVTVACAVSFEHMVNDYSYNTKIPLKFGSPNSKRDLLLFVKQCVKAIYQFPCLFNSYT